VADFLPKWVKMADFLPKIVADFFMAEKKILLVEAGHYETEQYTKDIFCDIITKKFPNFAVQYTDIEPNSINYL
jgi:hypothetical protein